MEFVDKTINTVINNAEFVWSRINNIKKGVCYKQKNI